MLAKENNCEDLEEDVDLLECSDPEQVFGKVFRRDLWGSLSWGAPFRPQGPDIPLRLRSVSVISRVPICSAQRRSFPHFQKLVVVTATVDGQNPALPILRNIP